MRANTSRPTSHLTRFVNDRDDIAAKCLDLAHAVQQRKNNGTIAWWHVISNLDNPSKGYQVLTTFFF